MMGFKRSMAGPVAAAAMGLAFAGGAQAESVLFVFADHPGQLASSIEFTGSDGSTTVVATASTDGGTVTPLVSQSILGLGVLSDPVKIRTFFGTLVIPDDLEIDGFGPDETLTLTFGQPVMIEHALFSLVGGNDDIRIEADNGVFDVDDPDALLGFSFESFSPAPSGGVFGFTVQNANDDYKLKALKVKTMTDPTNGKIIPTPSAALGGMAMLAAAGAWRTRRRSDLA